MPREWTRRPRGPPSRLSLSRLTFSSNFLRSNLTIFRLAGRGRPLDFPHARVTFCLENVKRFVTAQSIHVGRSKCVVRGNELDTGHHDDPHHRERNGRVVWSVGRPRGAAHFGRFDATMATCFQHLARRTAAPAAACLLSASVSLTGGGGTSLCEAPPPKAQDAEAPTGTPPPPVPEASSSAPSGIGTARVSRGVSVQHFQAYHSRSPPPPPRRSGQEGIDTEPGGDDAELYHGLFPTRQLFHPTSPYPLWNYNWDGRRPPVTGDPAADKKRDRHIRKTGVTRHIILVRHGTFLQLFLCTDPPVHSQSNLLCHTPVNGCAQYTHGRRIFAKVPTQQLDKTLLLMDSSSIVPGDTSHISRVSCMYSGAQWARILAGRNKR